MTTRQVEEAARILWNYMKLGQPARSADVLLVLGSLDDRVASYAARLSQQYDYSLAVFSGGVAHTDDLLATSWGRKTEAGHFYDVFLTNGGTADQVVLEEQSRNTGENAQLSANAIATLGSVRVQTIQLVTKPYMERRALATFECQWPQPRPQFFVTSPTISFEDYPDSKQPFDSMVNIMVGDMQRIFDYPARGWQTPQDVPESVMAAHAFLIVSGFTKHI